MHAPGGWLEDNGRELEMQAPVLNNGTCSTHGEEGGRDLL